jgi:hypothetical protein
MQELDDLSRDVWRAMSVGLLDDIDAGRLAETIHARRTIARTLEVSQRATEPRTGPSRSWSYDGWFSAFEGALISDPPALGRRAWLSRAYGRLPQRRAVRARIALFLLRRRPLRHSTRPSLCIDWGFPDVTCWSPQKAPREH